MATIYFNTSTKARKRELAGQIVRNTPTAIHIGGHNCQLIVPMQWVDHVTYDTEAERT